MAKKQARRKRRAFTPEFKAEAVRLCKVGDRTVRQVAKDLTETALLGLAAYDTRYPRDWDRRARMPGLCYASPREALGSAEQSRTADQRSASELSSDQEKGRSMRRRA